METCMRFSGATLIALFAILYLSGCSDPVGVPPEQGGGSGNGTAENVDAVLEAFSFTSATKTSGKPPSVSDTRLIKTSTKDTIFTMPGVKDMIRVSHPPGTPIKGIYFAFQGSTFYYNAPADYEEKSDTVSIIFFEIDAEDIEDEISSGSTSVPLEITAYDESDKPIDMIERIMTIEKPSSNGCDILEHIWFWDWSVIFNHLDEAVNVNCSDERYPNDFKYQDCCLGAAFCPKYDDYQQPVYDVNIDISLFYSIAAEWLQFYSDGLFERETREFESYISNPGQDAATFDPCKWKPEISTRTETVTYWGTHDYKPGNSTLSYIITDDSCGPNGFGCGFGGSLVGAEIIYTCHQLLISRGTEQKTVRMFTRGKATEDMEGEITDSWKFWD